MKVADEHEKRLKEVAEKVETDAKAIKAAAEASGKAANETAAQMVERLRTEQQATMVACLKQFWNRVNA
jgi:hypothetical protein